MGQVFAFIKARARAFRRRAARRAGVVVSAAVVTAAVALVGAAGMAPADAVSIHSPAATTGVSAAIAGAAQAAGSSAPCFNRGEADCSSSDPAVSFGVYSSGDTAACEFQEDIVWDDGTTNDYTYPGGTDGTQLDTFTHTYSKPGTYAIMVTAKTTAGSCGVFDSYTLNFTLLSAAAPPPSAPSCDSSYLTVVTDNAGYAVAALPELFTDKVSVTWCTGSGGAYVRIVSASQHPSVESAGFSVSGAEIRALRFAGIEFGVTPATGPAPAIHNVADYATAVASGLSFTGDFNLGADMVDFVASKLAVKPLAAELAPLIRHGDWGRVSQVLLKWWNKFAVAFTSWARNFGLPKFLASSVEKDMPVEKIVEKVVKLTGTLASMTAQTLAALNTNVTAQDVIDAVKHAIQQEADFVDYRWTAWAPHIVVKVGPAALVHVTVYGKTDLAITVEDPSTTTTP